MEKKGIVYVLTNPAMPDLVKIGMTTREHVDGRMKELYSTGVPVPFECAYACEVEDCEVVEKALHTAFGPNRPNPNREFFTIDKEQAIAILKLFNKTDITSEIQSEQEAELSDEEKEAIENLNEEIKNIRRRRSRLNFTEMGIPDHAKLTFKNNPEIEVIVTGAKKVLYNNQELSLTAVTKQLLGITRPIQPTGYWLYEGTNLMDIYNETY